MKWKNCLRQNIYIRNWKCFATTIATIAATFYVCVCVWVNHSCFQHNYRMSLRLLHFFFSHIINCTLFHFYIFPVVFVLFSPSSSISKYIVLLFCHCFSCPSEKNKTSTIFIFNFSSCALDFCSFSLLSVICSTLLHFDSNHIKNNESQNEIQFSAATEFARYAKNKLNQPKNGVH